MESCINSGGRISIYNNPIRPVPFIQAYTIRDIDDKFIADICNDSKIKVLQIEEYIPNNVLSMLNNKLFSKRSDIEFRIFGFYAMDGKCNLGFLQYMNNIQRLSIDCISKVENLELVTVLKNLKNFNIDVYELEDYSFIKNINSQLLDISISARSRVNKHNFDCEWLQRFSSLEKLYLRKFKKILKPL